MEQFERIIDLSHSMESEMTVFPGDRQAQFVPSSNFSNDGYRELFINIQSHTGTHIDAPSHILQNGKTISDFNITKFCGKACVLPHSANAPLTVEHLKDSTDILQSVDFVLINTGWDLYWKDVNYLKKFPLPGINIFEYLSGFNLKGVGIDAISVDPVNSKDLPNHHILLSKEIIIIENLTNLSLINEKIFDFYCLPLPIKNGDGAPVRAFARFNT